ncbi:hypothetical protein ACFYE8_26510 [Rhizobium leguminosarum]|uniref:hypothetical protein n=1 Tax=Rhizobium leguminosarum TaxID=384 RepID=UPI0036DC4D9C
MKSLRTTSSWPLANDAIKKLANANAIVPRIRLTPYAVSVVYLITTSGDIVKMGMLRVALLIAIASMLCGCGIPPMRAEREFPKQEVWIRLECELYAAVLNASALQAVGSTRDTLQYFDLNDFAATLVLTEKSTRSGGASLGAGFNNLSSDRTFSSGFGSFPGLGVSTINTQSDSGERVVFLADIITPRKMSDGRTFSEKCDQMRTEANRRNRSKTGDLPNPTPGRLPIGEPLGIGPRLNSLLVESQNTAVRINNEEMYFDFTVTIGAGGLLTAIEPTRSFTLGVGADRTFNETLKLTIARISKS